MPRPVAESGKSKRRYFDRLFFAVFPEERIAAQIEDFAKRFLAQHGIRGRLPAANRFHVSLTLVSNSDGLSPDAVAAASASADLVRMAPFEISLNQVATFHRRNGKNQPVVLLVDEGKAQLRTLLLALLDGLRGFPAAEKSVSEFNPHLTLLYGDRLIAHAVEAVSWTVRDFVLVHSLVGRTQYRILGKWPLIS